MELCVTGDTHPGPGNLLGEIVASRSAEHLALKEARPKHVVMF